MNTTIVHHTINVRDFTTTPGGRFITDGPDSGEEFLKKVLRQKFDEVRDAHEMLVVDFDGTEGYATSFLEEAFGGLARLYPEVNLLDHIEFISTEEPLLVDEVKGYIRDAKQ
jgi:hypothetical protein